MARGGSPAQLALFEATGTRRRRQRYVPAYDHHSPEVISHANEVLDRLLAQRHGLKPYEGRCLGCGRAISSKAPNCGRRTCSAVYPKWSRDQRRVTAEALREYGGLVVLTNVTLPGTPEQERHRRNVAIPWGADRRGEAKALYKANRRFKRRMRFLKRKAYNDARSVLGKAGYEFDRLPPVLVANLEVQRRGALHAHLALPYTTPLEMTFSRAFIDAMKRWAPLCGLGYVQGWKAAERSKVLGHEKAIAYLTKYLTGKHPPEFLRTISGPVLTVSRSLTRRTGVTMVALRKARRLWSAREGRCPMPDWSSAEFAAVAKVLDRRPASTRAP
jgi:hypothetical protein